MKVFISCGELSGENHALGVVKELSTQNRNIEIYAFGSSLLEKQGVKILEDYQDYSFSGITEVAVNLNKILKLQNSLLKKLEKLKPDLVLLIDYGGFNLELARKIKKSTILKNTQILEFIAPQIWASRPWRIQKIKKYVDKVFCTLDFEERIYKEAGIDVKYVGNPVLGSLNPTFTKHELLSNVLGSRSLGQLNNSPEPRTQNQEPVIIGIFPGSRKSEIKEMLPRMLKAARKLSEEIPSISFKFLVSKAPSISYELFKKYGIEAYSDIVELMPDIDKSNHKLLSAADALWLCSGTVTLEAALYGTPYFLAYRSNLLNFLIYKIFRIGKMAGLANIIQGKYIVKEFLQYEATTENFIKETKSWLRSDSPNAFSRYYYEIEANLKKLKDKISGFHTYKLVADEVNSCLD